MSRQWMYVGGHRCKGLALSAVFLAGLLAAPGSASAMEVQMYVVTDWLDTECTQGDRGGWDDMVDGWYDNMGLLGHTKQRRYVDSNLSRNFLCDPDGSVSGCKDYKYGDAGDAVMFGFHGADSGNHWRGSMRKGVGTGSSQDCTIDAPEGDSAELLLGDVDTEFLHLSSCNSMDDDNLTQAWRMFRDPVDSQKRKRYMHGATGFHGMMGIGSVYNPDYSTFATLGHIESVRDAWLDTQYHPEMDNPKCPIAYAVGTGKDDCLNRIHNESYANVFSDPPELKHYCYSYFENCDPAAEDAFVPPN